jgi:hypothetical protein
MGWQQSHDPGLHSSKVSRTQFVSELAQPSSVLMSSLLAASNSDTQILCAKHTNKTDVARLPCADRGNDQAQRGRLQRPATRQGQVFAVAVLPAVKQSKTL